MILTDRAGGIQLNWRRWIRSVFAILAMLFLFWLVWGMINRETTPSSQASADAPELVFCDAEKTSGDFFVTNGDQFQGANRRSSAHAFSGSYSCELGKGEGLQYGMTYAFPTYKAGDIFRATVWRYRPEGGREAYLVASAEGEGGFYLTEYLPSETRADGWEKLQVSCRIPLNKKTESFKVYVFTNGKVPAFFDDLKIEKIASLQDSMSQPFEVVNLQLGGKGLQKLKDKRQSALQVGILQSGEDDWVNAKLVSSQQPEKEKVKMRLKGDWLDHLAGKKWSFRVKMRGEGAWNRMREFSLHTPKARNFAREWLLHEFFKREDVLTTRYDFLELQLNGNPLGIYAIEEHFNKTLVEYKHRREGPILKFSEDGFWEGIARNLRQFDGIDHDLDQTVMWMENADIQAFKEGQIKKNPVLARHFETAQKAMYQYRYGLTSASDLFDLDKLARYYAISDIMGAYHGMAWHNQRFYFNPVTNLLEPIGFDGFGSHAPKRNFLLGQGALNPRKVNKEKIDNKLFQDQAFTKIYIQYLYKYSSPEYIKDFMAEVEPGLRVREALIQEEFKKYTFHRQDFYKNTQRVHALILPYQDLSIRAYTASKTENALNLQLANTHGLPLEVIGYGRTKEAITDTLEAPVLMEGFYPRLFKSLIEQNNNDQILLDTFTGAMAWQAYREQQFMQFNELQVKPFAKYVFFRPFGLDTIYHAAISDWKSPVGSLPAVNIFERYPLRDHPAIRKSRGMIYFKKGQYQLKEPLTIPKGYRVHFEAGCELDLVNGASILTRSPVFMYGTEEEPVVIKSSNNTGQGLTVLQAGMESELNYVIFDQLDRFKYENWELTGAVTFYESDVSINHSVFSNNRCEDGLNIIRSEFSLNNSKISHAFSDGLDADFCKGYINKSTFYKAGNDGMDLSGSTILIDNCFVDQCGDKGVSIGEESDATIFKVDIRGTPIGVASKDLSVLTIRHIALRNCEQGFTAYQKKPEYGGGTIVVQNYFAKDVKRLHNIRKGSTLQLKKKVIEGEW